MADERTYESPPGMLQLFARAGVAMIPGASRLPLVGGTRSKEVPPLTLTLPSVTVDRDRLASYNRVCGFGVSDTLPATFPHILAFPLHLALMTDPSFPFPAIGLVHISNRITVHRPIGAEETLSFKVSAAPLEPHPRGQQFSILTEASVGDEVVWDESSTNLRRGGGSGERESGSGGGSRRSGGSQEEPLPATATWKLAGDLGRRYASVSGDMNPIHMHPLSARLFGFPSAIAHGMWTKARCLAAMELPNAFTVEVAFKKPILLPSTVEFGEQGGRFEVRDAKKGTPHVAGSLS